MENFLNISTSSNVFGAEMLVNSEKSNLNKINEKNLNKVQTTSPHNFLDNLVSGKEEIFEDLNNPREYDFDVNYPPTSLKRHRHTKFGNHTYDPSAGDKKDFLQKLLPTLPKNPFTMPIVAELYFYEARPKSHYRTGKFSGELKPTAPKKNVVKKDIDNFVKFVFDTLNSHLYKDDSQIYELKCGKYYSERGYGYITGKFTEVNNS
jgi:Holliday junction resolvase RusA-like endonuclease